jgi:hypothetical protein
MGETLQDIASITIGLVWQAAFHSAVIFKVL